LWLAEGFRTLQQAVVSCKDSFNGSDVLAASEHGATGRRPNIHAHFVGREKEDGLDTLPARAAERQPREVDRKRSLNVSADG